MHTVYDHPCLNSCQNFSVIDGPLFVSIIHETNASLKTEKRTAINHRHLHLEGTVHCLVPQLRGYLPSLDPELVFPSPFNFLRQLIVFDRTYLKDSGHRHY